jgi:hypothetical protein
VALDAVDESTEALELKLGEALARERLELGLEEHGRSIPAGNAIVTR